MQGGHILRHVELLFFLRVIRSFDAWRCHLPHEKASYREAAQEEKGGLNQVELGVSSNRGSPKPWVSVKHFI